MAKPQLEDGHTRIANEILEHLMKMHLAPNQWQVLLCIFRKTYGFHKKVDYIANSQIGESTDLGKVAVSRCLKELEGSQFITRKGKYIGFQKDWEQWGKLPKSATSKESIIGSELAESATFPDGKSCRKRQTKLPKTATELPKSATKVSSPRVTQKKKDTLTKDTIQKRRYGEFNNVLLTDEEYQKLVTRFGEKGTAERIESLSLGIESKGYKYQSHYATILAWEKRDRKGGQGGTSRQNSRRLPPTYTDPREARRQYQEGHPSG